VKKACTLLVFLVLGLASFSQIKKDSSLLQFSGVFLDADSLTPVPWVNIVVVNRNQGTTTDFNGTFSFVAHAGDTVRFTCVGYKPFQCVIPDSLKTKRYTLVQLFSKDTINLPEAVIFPWPSKEQFREAFLTLHIPDDDMERAKKNLELMERKAQYEEIGSWGSINYQLVNQAYTEKLYYAGQAPPLSIFDPFAWASFFKALKDGSLKDPNKKDKKK
tara:strand:- start:9012 stop:9662 length:651 start_codon:yes stop_codon:yes gene_type:complete